MRIWLLLLLVLITRESLHAQDVNFEWVRQVNTSESGLLVSNSIAVDATGNVYTAGTFSGTVDFDPGPAVFNLSTVYSSDNDIFISKLDIAGNFVWAKQFKSTGNANNTCNSITLDNQGNLYTTGHFYGTVDFDPGPATFNFSANGIQSIWAMFISKLDANGNFILAKQISGGSSSHIEGKAICTDAAGNIFTTGSFDNSTIDFDPGPGESFLTSNHSVGRIFVSKLNAAGDFIWARQMITNVDTSFVFGSEGRSIAVDPSGNVFTTGYFGGTVDFNPGAGEFNLSSIYGSDFISKLDASGNFIWAKHAQQVSHSYITGNSIKLDAAANIYTTGYFNGTIDFDPGTGIFNMSAAGNGGSGDIYVSKFNVNGDLLWTRQMGGFLGDEASSMSLDMSGNIYITGYFQSLADFDPGPATYDLQSNGTEDVFIACLDPAGNFIWAKQLGGLLFEVSSAIAVDELGAVYTTGLFGKDVDFDPGNGVYIVSPLTSQNIFIHKMSTCANRTFATITASACNTYSLNGYTYDSSGLYKQRILNVAGCDSIITLDLTINGSKKIFTAESCNSYSWNGHIYTASGTYADTLADSNGCDSILILQLQVKNVAANVINASICTGQNYEGYTNAGTYIDTLIATNGCDSIRTINLVVKNNCIPISIPNAFTPNGDALNDIFKPTITEQMTGYSFTIFNRYGQKVFETRNYPAGWDGKYNGKQQPPGSYIYFIRYTSGNGWPKEEKGTFLLLR